MKSKLRQSGILTPLNKKIIDQPYESCESVDLKLDWLKNYLDPEETIIDYWILTFEARQDLIKKRIEIYNYYQSFPCLKIGLGATLLKKDFDRLYPNKNDLFFDRWDIIRTHLIKRLQECNSIKHVFDKAFIHLLPTLLQHSKDTLIFYLLPYLIEGSLKRKRNSRNSQVHSTKLSIQERRDSFLLHVQVFKIFYLFHKYYKIYTFPFLWIKINIIVKIYFQTATDIIPTIERRKEELRIAGLTFQPIPVFVGQLIALDATYVAVNNVLYKVDSALKAIDLCFRIYMALDCAYPEQASSLWVFIQKCCFNIHLQSDVCNQSLNGLIEEVEVLFSSND
ncbi:PREDICTED: uncharacterized protein LOC105449701 isoform X1 [Wasmannia auropunctata]|uniref:uncharacterized protein LOC105449701 isoform X1 n=1 Tax=Wasmannia auropunctata TaxID=64793 RepID=UPI0005EDAA03|nr:PREDICTED: uncharacterized protein LOC105449701 isoform X1 [Wasmannia auropunctata]XP_011687375.1 PREDICTED: uncharacterized protein LOC105449701 isoform X1 [Wasmannia auropunctata]